VKQIEVCVKNLYKLDVEDCVALSTKEEKVEGCDVSELWHKRLGHLHNGTLNIIQKKPLASLKEHLSSKMYVKDVH